MKTIDDILDYYRAEAKSTTALGNAFEKFVRAYLRHDPVQKTQFKNIKTYREWSGDRDIGIDLVAELSDGMGLAAIQCKCREENDTITFKTLSTFLALSGGGRFARRVVIDTTATEWGTNLKDALEKQDIPVTRIGLKDLRASPLVWAKFNPKDSTPKITAKPKKKPRRHQKQAIKAVLNGFANNDRGKMIMACGTGKTFTALQIAEKLAGKGKCVLYVVPSLALMAQTIREWADDASLPLRSFSVCSDDQVGRRKNDSSDGDEDEDFMIMEKWDLVLPATTDAKYLAKHAKSNDKDSMTIIYSTYQSVHVVKEAQKLGLPDFDLIICDEAHRTAGIEDKTFGMINHDKNVRGKKRLYMTATPIVFGDKALATAEDKAITLYSMDNEKIYGPAFYTLNFGHAVTDELLCDYKVIVFGVDEKIVEDAHKKNLHRSSEIDLNDESKIIGCYKALQKQTDDDELKFEDPDKPMRRAIAFCNTIKKSEAVKKEFGRVVDGFLAYLATQDEAEGKIQNKDLKCAVEHVDGTFDANSRNEILKWLADDLPKNESRILSNVRCLSEGVDVPALDAIALFHPRKSQIDVVQCVGRVMRKAPDKSMGYVILPIVVPPKMSTQEALNDNKKYKVVWDTLNALRSHDEKFLDDINNLKLPSDDKKRIEFIGLGQDVETGKPVVMQMKLIFDGFTKAIIPRIVKKCGKLDYWHNEAESSPERMAEMIAMVTRTQKP